MKYEVKKYMTAYSFWWTVSAVLWGALIVIFIVSALAGNNVTYGGLVFFIVMLGLSLIPIFWGKKHFDGLEQSGQLKTLEEEFLASTPMLKDRIRFGNERIFLKGKKKTVSYGEIRQIYQYIHKQNFIENERALKYVDQKGKHRVLCQLKLRGKSDGDVQKIAGIIMSKNPGVKLGYR